MAISTLNPPAVGPAASPLVADPTSPDPAPGAADPAEVATRSLVIVSWSGELDRIWPTLILASTAAASARR